MKYAVHTGMRIKTRGALIAALALTAGIPLMAQQQARPRDRPVHSVVEREADEKRILSQPANGQSIVVHGHWVLDLKDKDGRLIEHRDFYNSLTSDGLRSLVVLLGGKFVPSNLEMQVVGQAGATIYDYFTLYPSAPNVSAAKCSASSNGGNVGYCQPTVTETVDVTSASASIKLQGQLTAARQTSIFSVSTNVAMCGSLSADYAAVTPGDCHASGQASSSTIFGLTFANLSTPINMVAGQVLTIGVTLSFS